jgi:hypothetical protein
MCKSPPSKTGETRLVYLAAKQAAVSTFLAWAPQFKVVVLGVLNIQFA